MSLRNVNLTRNFADSHPGLLFTQDSPSSLRFVSITRNIVRTGPLYEIATAGEPSTALIEHWIVADNTRHLSDGVIGRYVRLKCVHRNCLFVVRDGPLVLVADVSEVKFVGSSSKAKKSLGENIVWSERPKFQQFTLACGGQCSPPGGQERGVGFWGRVFWILLIVGFTAGLTRFYWSDVALPR
jgi:hypothetical protein